MFVRSLPNAVWPKSPLLQACASSPWKRVCDLGTLRRIRRVDAWPSRMRLPPHQGTQDGQQYAYGISPIARLRASLNDKRLLSRSSSLSAPSKDIVVHTTHGGTWTGRLGNNGKVASGWLSHTVDVVQLILTHCLLGFHNDKPHFVASHHAEGPLPHRPSPGRLIITQHTVLCLVDIATSGTRFLGKQTRFDIAERI
ncbi:hypothetical protein LZ30DRAFT_313787 [Colletotrichum cereale]|nr:hypothetical protein LZ30DRAFT_313787 [Colletotrichum cereale]